ncbi:MAG: DUF1592 domain-containing protein [Myxococcaceae bacterium]|nr:DUF1592 domain-containing protein [Myxococcaceae bacterium]
MRRLSRRELLRAITRLTGVEVETELPGFDVRTLAEGAPKTFFFDTGFAWQATSLDSLVTADELARAVAARVTSSPQRLERVLGCAPSAGREAACLGAFLDRAGRLSLRRPLEPEERERLLSTALAWARPQAGAPPGEVAGPFPAAHFLVRVLLQHPEFLSLVEDGAPSPHDPTVLVLSDTAVATRLALLLWGELPDDALLDAAVSGTLHTPAQVRHHAERMLSDPRARTQVFAFHAQWLGFSRLDEVVTADLARSMRAETRALIDDVVFDRDAPWVELLTSQRTWLDTRLAGIYGLPAPATGPGWVTYPSPDRGGLLSHGSVLATSGPGSATSRGLFVRERLLCQPLHTPADVSVDVDAVNDPALGECRSERLRAHVDNPGCASCHQLIDPIGFGLLRYNGQGAVQSTEADKPNCPLPREGSVTLGSGTTPFAGPGPLGRLLAGAPEVTDCLARQFFRFRAGKAETSDVDERHVQAFVQALRQSGGRLRPALLDTVSSPAFLTRRIAAKETP